MNDFDAALSATVFADSSMGLGYGISLPCLICSAASIAAALIGRRKYRDAAHQAA